MYQPRAFREDDPQRLAALATKHSFATMIVVQGEAQHIAHVPVVVDADLTRVRLHVAMANPIWRAALAAKRVTLVFSGPHAYVSASWYEDPAGTVPTWNYAVVHATGTPTRLAGPELEALLDDLVRLHEPDRAWSTAGADRAMIDQLLLEIVGLSIEVTAREGKFKLSQNRTPADHARVIAGLRRRGAAGDEALADLMATTSPLAS